MTRGGIPSPEQSSSPTPIGHSVELLVIRSGFDDTRIGRQSLDLLQDLFKKNIDRGKQMTSGVAVTLDGVSLFSDHQCEAN